MRLLKLLVVLTVFFCLAVTAFAHPGKTDSQGGHTDHSTGEYHYHHGYSAHQHYDSDGDGDLDCPYNFDDQTGISSGESTETEYGVFSELEKIKQDQKARENELDSTEDFEDMVAKHKRAQIEASDKATTASENVKTFWDYARDIFLFLLELYIVVGFVWGVIRLIKLLFQN